MKNTITFKNIDKLILFGGARLLVDFAVHFKASFKLPIIVFSAARHLDEAVNEQKETLRTVLTRADITYYESPDINTDERLRREITPGTLGIAMGAAWMFTPQTAALFALGYLLDFMGIDLPRYRGGAHYTWQILHGQRKGCANLQVIHGGEQTFHRGEIIARKEYTIPRTAVTPQDFFNFIAPREVQFLDQFLRGALRGTRFTFRVLDESMSSFYPALSTKNHAFINWSWSGHDIALFIQAFDDPYMGAATYLRGKEVRLKGCRLLRASEKYHPFTSGIVVRKDDTGLYIAAVQGLLAVKRIIDETGNDVTRTIILGDRFYTPLPRIDEAMEFKAIYNPQGLKFKDQNAK